MLHLLVQYKLACFVLFIPLFVNTDTRHQTPRWSFSPSPSLHLMFLLTSFFYIMDQVPENPGASAVAAAVPAEDNNVANDPAHPNAAAPVSHQVSFLLFMFASVPGFVPACALSSLYSYYAISLFLVLL